MKNFAENHIFEVYSTLHFEDDLVYVMLPHHVTFGKDIVKYARFKPKNLEKFLEFGPKAIGIVVQCLHDDKRGQLLNNTLRYLELIRPVYLAMIIPDGHFIRPICEKIEEIGSVEYLDIGRIENVELIPSLVPSISNFKVPVYTESFDNIKGVLIADMLKETQQESIEIQCECEELYITCYPFQLPKGTITIKGPNIKVLKFMRNNKIAASLNQELTLMLETPNLVKLATNLKIKQLPSSVEILCIDKSQDCECVCPYVKEVEHTNMKEKIDTTKFPNIITNTNKLSEIA